MLSRTTSKEPTAHSVKGLSDSGASLAAMLKYTRPKHDDREECAMAKVRVGLVGCGFAAELHMYAYQRVYGVDAQVTAVAARGDHVLDFAKKHQIRRTRASMTW
jgi:hypothetical protein